MEVVKALIAKDADVNAKDKVCEALARDLEHEDFPASAVDRKSGKAAASGPSVYLYSLPVCSSLPPAPLPLSPFLLSTSSWLPLPPPFSRPLFSTSLCARASCAVSFTPRRHFCPHRPQRGGGGL